MEAAKDMGTRDSGNASPASLSRFNFLSHLIFKRCNRLFRREARREKLQKESQAAQVSKHVQKRRLKKKWVFQIPPRRFFRRFFCLGVLFIVRYCLAFLVCKNYTLLYYSRTIHVIKLSFSGDKAWIVDAFAVRYFLFDFQPLALNDKRT